MNARMWEHPATQANVELLRARGVELVGPDEGELAEGETARAGWPSRRRSRAQSRRLLAPAPGAARAARARHRRRHARAARRRALSSATARPAAWASRSPPRRAARGRGDAARRQPRRAARRPASRSSRRRRPPISSARRRSRGGADVVLMAAAVADYRPAERPRGQAPEGRRRWTVELEPTADVLAALGERERNGQVLVGFGAETGARARAEARRKLESKSARPRRLQRRGARRHRLRRDRQRGRAGDADGRAARCRRRPSERSRRPILDEVERLLEERRWKLAGSQAAPAVDRRGGDRRVVDEPRARRARAGARRCGSCVLCLVAEGHLIIEDFPGVGKTMLAKALARSLDCSFSRLQFTPDLLPSDVTGVSVFDQRTNEFEFRPGPGLREPPARRRDQPRLAEDAVGAARVHAGEPGHGRRRDVRARAGRSWSSRPRTRSSTRARTRCPRRSSTASRCGSRSATRRSPRRRGCWRSRRREPPLDVARARRERRGRCSRAIAEAQARLRRGEPQPLRRRAPAAHAHDRRASRSARARARASRCCASRRRARSRTGATTCCPTTSRPSRAPVLAHRLILVAGGARGRPDAGRHRARGGRADARPGLTPRRADEPRQARASPRRSAYARRVGVRRRRRSIRSRSGSSLAPLGARVWVQARRRARSGCAGVPAAARTRGRRRRGRRSRSSPASRVPPPARQSRERLARLGESEVPLRLDGRACRGRYVRRARAARALPLRAGDGRARGSLRPRARSSCRCRAGRAARRLAAARRTSTGSSPRAARTPRTAGGCCCGARPASTCTASASTSAASRCARCTGRRPRAAGS